jgi:hypothetical protein
VKASGKLGLTARLAAVPLLAFVALIAVVGSPASAAPAAPATHEQATGTMHIVRFDAKVAAAHGYEIRIGENGRQYSVKVGTAAGAGTVSPANQVDGNCGSSYVYYTARGNSSASISTGFNLFYPADSYWWFVRINDAGGQNNHIYAGGLGGSYGWSVFDVVGGLSHGYSQATVSTASSALLVNGGVCTSGGPWDYDYVY